jgi:hypothetical protein
MMVLMGFTWVYILAKAKLVVAAMGFFQSKPHNLTTKAPDFPPKVVEELMPLSYPLVLDLYARKSSAQNNLHGTSSFKHVYRLVQLRG